jgi:hypothetical protein
LFLVVHRSCLRDWCTVPYGGAFTYHLVLVGHVHDPDRYSWSGSN